VDSAACAKVPVKAKNRLTIERRIFTRMNSLKSKKYR
jgi:hypothetical protein